MKKTNKKNRFYGHMFVFALVFLAVCSLFFSDTVLAADGLVPCGKSGQEMCTLCDLLKGFHGIIQYIMKISVVVALTTFTLAGSSYAISFGGQKEIELAKGAMKNAVIGLVIILTAWILVNTVFLILGANTNLGVSQASSWWQFECAAPNN